jgi:hypothetical protein
MFQVNGRAVKQRNWPKGLILTNILYPLKQLSYESLRIHSGSEKWHKCTGKGILKGQGVRVSR